MDEEWFRSVSTALEDEVLAEFVPLEGEEEGEGSFLGIICSHEGNLDASERTKKARTRLKSKHLCLQEPDMLTTTPRSAQKSFQRRALDRFLAADTLSTVLSLPTCLFEERCASGRQRPI